jgi:hypothetical protein
MRRTRLTLSYARTANIVLCAGLLAYAVTRGAESGVDLHVGSVGGQIGDLLGFATLCGLLAYATVELTKRLTGLRGSVNLAVVEGWLADQEGELGIAVARREDAETEKEEDERELGERGTKRRRRRRPPTPRAAPRPVGEQYPLPPGWFDGESFPLLLQALGTRDLHGVFDLPPERLVAQISTAIDVALFQRDTYGMLLVTLARIPPRRLEAEYEQEPQLLGSYEAQKLRLSLDDLQTMLTQTWRRIVQSGVVWIAGSYGVLATFAGGLSGTNQARYLLAALILGGPVAWTIRDLTAVAERLRR